MLQPNQTILSVGCKIAHWKAYSSPDEVLVGHICKFLLDSLIFFFLSRMSSIMRRRENYVTTNSCCPACLSRSFCSETKKTEPGHLKFTFYSHEIWTGPNATLLLAAGTGQGMSNMSAMGWGSFYVFDNPLRTGPGNDSKVVGHSTGTAVATSVQPVMTTGGLYMVADHIFDKSSKYNGSRITVIGTVATARPPYELLVPGGLGHFLGCKGWASVSSVPATPPAHICKWDYTLNCH
jgi:hypothetical protein